MKYHCNVWLYIEAYIIIVITVIKKANIECWLL